LEEGIRIIENGISEVVIKKSRFLGTAANVSSEEEARALVNAIRKEHYSARHVCYAYSVGETNPNLKFSDDGEPGGTAGKPMLDVITNSGISNIVVIVVRYFGGVLLGTGGLVRAYTQAAQEAINAAEKKIICLSRIYEITLEYTDFDKVKYLIDNTEGASCQVAYSDKVSLTLTVPDKSADSLIQQLTEKTAGRSFYTLVETKML